MSLRFLVINIVILFGIILFFVPLSKNGSKSDKFVEKVKENIQEVLPQEKKEPKLNNEFYNQNIELKERNILEEYQLQRKLKETNDSIKEVLEKEKFIYKEKTLNKKQEKKLEELKKELKSLKIEE